MAKLTDGQARLFTEPNFGVVATLREDGSVHQSVTWVDYDGANVVFNTAEGRAKPQNLRRDGHASVLVINRNNPREWVAVWGPATLSHDGAIEHIDSLAKKYRGDDTYGVAPDERRVIVTVVPERVIGQSR